MSKFSPVCPKCSKNDEIVFLKEGGNLYLNKYYCKRCKLSFDAEQGFSGLALSVYQANPSSISGSEYLISSGP
jgi:transposase-like protein